jgi:hypothetical protein
VSAATALAEIIAEIIARRNARRNDAVAASDPIITRRLVAPIDAARARRRDATSTSTLDAPNARARSNAPP